jgi:hypothetical protein
MPKNNIVTHDEARELEYISQQEKKAKDIKRYFELQGMFALLTKTELNEYYKLQQKLSKEGE